MIRAEFRKLGRKYIEMARDLTPEDQELLVRGMLMENVLLKTDAGVQSAKQLGADKRVSMWRADSQVGVIVLQPPPAPKIDHEVPLFPVEHNEEEPIVMQVKSHEEPEPLEEDISPDMSQPPETSVEEEWKAEK